MKEPLNISKPDPIPSSMDAESMKQAGIDYIRQLAHAFWTDYNEHDPGITALEQLCYALIDLGYRIHYPIEDILAAANAGEASQPQFYAAREVFSIHPQSKWDILRLLLDCTDVKHAFVEEIKGPDSSPVGLYKVWLLPEEHLLIKPEDGETKQAHILEQQQLLLQYVDEKLSANRSLGIDFLPSSIVARVPAKLKLEIEINDKEHAEQSLAKVLFKIKDYFTPRIPFYSLQELYEEGLFTEEAFQGPALQHGFLKTADLIQNPIKQNAIDPATLQLANLFGLQDILLDIEEVKWISRLSIEVDSNAHFDGEGNPQRPVFFQFDFEPELHFPDIRATYGGSPTEIKVADLQRFLQDMEQASQGKKQRGRQMDIAVPPGNYRHIDRYYSIQHHFPSIYGLGKEGMPPPVGREKGAKLKQFRAYLLLFEQILANYFMLLDQAKHLFSIGHHKGHKPQEIQTYFAGFPESVPEIWSLINDQSLSLSILGVIDQVENDILQLIKKKLPPGLPQNAWQDRYEKIKRWISTALYESRKVNAFASMSTDELRGWLAPPSMDGYSQEYKLPALSMETYFAGLADDWYAATTDEPALKKTILKSMGQLEGDLQKWLREKITLNYKHLLELELESPATKEERVSRLFSHLLARLGERFDEESFRLYAFSNKKNLNQEIIAAKQRILANFLDLSANRGRGMDYSRLVKAGTPNNNALAWEYLDPQNISGLENRLYHMLGIDNPAYLSLGKIWRQINSLEPPLANDAALMPYGLRLDAGASSPGLYEQLKLVLRYGIERKNYQVSTVAGGVSVELNLPGAGGPATPLPISLTDQKGAAVFSPADAQNVIRDTAYYLKGLKNKCEGFYLVEEVLLRARDDDEPADNALSPPLPPYFEPFTAYLILPDWPARFQSAGFQQVLYRTLSQECPAHIYIQSLWLNAAEIETFEGLYARWLQQLDAIYGQQGAQSPAVSPTDAGLLAMVRAKLTELRDAIQKSRASTVPEESIFLSLAKIQEKLDSLKPQLNADDVFSAAVEAIDSLRAHLQDALNTGTPKGSVETLADLATELGAIDLSDAVELSSLSGAWQAGLQTHLKELPAKLGELRLGAKTQMRLLAEELDKYAYVLSERTIVDQVTADYDTLVVHFQTFSEISALCAVNIQMAGALITAYYRLLHPDSTPVQKEGARLAYASIELALFLKTTALYKSSAI